MRDTLYIPSDSVIIERDTLRTEIKYVEKDLTRWQAFKQSFGGWAFGVAVLGLIVAIVYAIIRFKF